MTRLNRPFSLIVTQPIDTKSRGVMEYLNAPSMTVEAFSRFTDVGQSILLRRRKRRCWRLKLVRLPALKGRASSGTIPPEGVIVKIRRNQAGNRHYWSAQEWQDYRIQ